MTPPRRRLVSRAAAGAAAALLLLGAVPTVASAAAATVEVPSTVAADCSVDVTPALNEIVAKARRGATIELAPGGCYRLDGSLLIRGKKDLTIAGNGASLEARTPGDKDRRHVWVWGGKNLVVRDLTVRGANPTPGPEQGYNGARPFQHGFALQGVRGARLERVTVTAVYGDFVYVGPHLENGRWSRDVVVRNSTLVEGGRQGIAVVAGKRVVIDRNEIGGAGQSLFDLEPNQVTQGAVDVRITRNRTGSARHFWLANKAVGTNIRDIVVKGNRMLTPTPGLVFVSGPADGFRGPMVFADNELQTTGTVSDDGSRGAFYLGRVQDVVVRGNRVVLPTGRGMPVVQSHSSLDVVVTDNEFVNGGEELLVTGPPPSPTPASRPTATTTAPRAATTAPRPSAPATTVSR